MTTKKEHKYEVCNTFKDWLAKNGHRFNRKCKIRHYKKRGILRLYFEDVTPEIRCSINERTGVCNAIYYKRKCWDLICDLECAIAHAKNGKYYCKFCDPPKLYDTYQELLIEHSFENFLEWVNETFTSSHVLELRKSVGGATEAIIIDTSLPDSLYTERRAAFGKLLKGLKRLPDGSPCAPKNSGEMKMTVIPVITGQGFDGLSGMSEAPPAEDE